MPKKILGQSNDTWRTPTELWNALNKQYTFKVDLCADENNAKCKIWLNDLKRDFYDLFTLYENFWINPPFSKAKEMVALALTLDHVVGIYRCDNMETAVWQEVILKKACWVYFFKGRIRYEDPEGNRTSPMFPSCLFGKGTDVPNDEFLMKYHGTLIIMERRT